MHTGGIQRRQQRDASGRSKRRHLTSLRSRTGTSSFLARRSGHPKRRYRLSPHFLHTKHVGSTAHNNEKIFQVAVGGVGARTGRQRVRRRHNDAEENCQSCWFEHGFVYSAMQTSGGIFQAIWNYRSLLQLRHAPRYAHWRWQIEPNKYRWIFVEIEDTPARLQLVFSSASQACQREGLGNTQSESTFTVVLQL